VPGRDNRAISKHPKQAHKEIFTSAGQDRSGLQALKDPGTGNIESDPERLSKIIQNFSLKAVNVKTGKYLPEDAPRAYPWEQSDAHDPFTLETHIIRDEKEHKKDPGSTPLS